MVTNDVADNVANDVPFGVSSCEFEEDTDVDAANNTDVDTNDITDDNAASMPMTIPTKTLTSTLTLTPTKPPT